MKWDGNGIHTCDICGHSGNYNELITYDYNTGNREQQFRYFNCSECGCLQLENKPKNMSEYYGDQLFGYKVKGEVKVKNQDIFQRLMFARDRYELTGKGLFGGILHLLFPRRAYGVIGSECEQASRIVEVGCGNGRLLKIMAQFGYRDLTGCDLYSLTEDVNTDGLSLIHGTLDDCEGHFDYIIMHHCFEHLDKPHETMRTISNKLNPTGAAIISIPVNESRVFSIFGKYWYNLDSPRHFYIYSPKGLQYLAQLYGLRIEKVIYDCDAFSYIGSIQYQKGMNGVGRRSIKGLFMYIFLAILKYSYISKEDNRSSCGDIATFIIKKQT